MVRVIESASEVNAGDFDVENIATIDMGGTIVNTEKNGSTSHKRLNNALGVTSESDKLIYDIANLEDGFDHFHHASHLTTEITNRNLDRELSDLEVYAGVVQYLINERSIVEGANEFISGLKQEGYTPMILSSNPKAVTVPFAEELGIDSVYRWKDYEFNRDGKFVNYFLNSEGRQGKQQVVESMQDEGAEVIHIGNGANDVKAIEQADYGIKRWDWMKNRRTAYQEALEEIREAEI